MAQDTSGPAFPCPPPIVNGNGDFIYGESSGMTLRDWFAGRAITGILSCETETFGYPLTISARTAYEIADAMLAARLPKKDA
jgi:hypothetical protein